MAPSNLTLTGLHFYPVKSCRGIDLKKMRIGIRGPENDRRWMIVDEQGKLLTQRRHPNMALIQTKVFESFLSLNAPGMPEYNLPAQNESEGRETIDVDIWGDEVRAVTCGEDASQWFSRFMGFPCRLVTLDKNFVRHVETGFAGVESQVGFTDVFPLLLISTASLEDLNSRLAQPIPMNRFRPNLVVNGCEPYAEDRWKKIRIGQMIFHLVTKCERCTVPTVDQDTAERSKEPLKTLSAYRVENNKIMFGKNAIHESEGELTLGQKVEVLE